MLICDFSVYISRSLCAIGEGCKKLKNLALSDCYFLSDKGLEAVAAGCSELTHLEVNGCHNIGTSGLEFMGRSCTAVDLIQYRHCSVAQWSSSHTLGCGDSGKPFSCNLTILTY
ncbi:hypothetical protein CsSME_00021076 [Camellia sinensis var. sinensis]